MTLFLAIHHFAASLLNENWKRKCEIPHVFSQFGLCGSHACSSGALHWCVCMCVCVYVQRRCTGWSGFFSLKATTKPSQINGTSFFVVYASSKLQSRSSRLKILLLFHLGKWRSMVFFPPFVAGPGTRKERLLKVKAVVLISYVYVLLMWEEAAPLPLCLVNLP